MKDVPDEWVEGLVEIASRLDQVVVSLDRLWTPEEASRSGSSLTQQFIREEGAESLTRARRVALRLLEQTIDKATLGEDEAWDDRIEWLKLPIWSSPE
jgi:hypothetical protein